MTQIFAWMVCKLREFLSDHPKTLKRWDVFLLGSRISELYKTVLGKLNCIIMLTCNLFSVFQKETRKKKTEMEKVSFKN